MDNARYLPLELIYYEYWNYEREEISIKTLFMKRIKVITSKKRKRHGILHCQFLQRVLMY